jgi:hypothetical protein
MKPGAPANPDGPAPLAAIIGSSSASHRFYVLAPEHTVLHGSKVGLTATNSERNTLRQ